MKQRTRERGEKQLPPVCRHRQSWDWSSEVSLADGRRAPRLCLLHLATRARRREEKQQDCARPLLRQHKRWTGFAWTPRVWAASDRPCLEITQQGGEEEEVTVWENRGHGAQKVRKCQRGGASTRGRSGACHMVDPAGSCEERKAAFLRLRM